MSPESIAHKKKLRYHRALAIAATAGAITRNGAAHQFYVMSQTGNGHRYLSATPEAVEPLGMCSCPDFQSFGRHNDIPCKHIYSAHIFEQAETFVREQAHKHGHTWQRVIDLARHHLEHATDDTVQARWHVVIATATRLKEVVANA